MLKIKEFEKENPHVDLTMLFDSKEVEAARLAQHKKAYASYKAYNFLKHGIKTGKAIDEQDNKPKVEKLSKAKLRMKKNDPFNFPELNESVAQVLTSDVPVPTLKDMGDMIKTPGRRVNGYSQQEYLESFFGKDMARRVTREGIDHTFVEEKTMKEKYPISMFSPHSRFDEKMKKWRELGYRYDYKQFPKLVFEEPAIAEEMSKWSETYMKIMNKYADSHGIANPIFDQNDIDHASAQAL